MPSSVSPLFAHPHESIIIHVDVSFIDRSELVGLGVMLDRIWDLGLWALGNKFMLGALLKLSFWESLKVYI